MTAEEFCRLAENLTGTPVKDVLDSKKASTRETLAKLLQDEGRTIEHTQLNELLLMVNKDRLEAPFFDLFFGAGCTVSGLRDGVVHFQKIAMLCYGNFIYAYRKLSRLAMMDALLDAMGEWAQDAEVLESEFASRKDKLVDIEPIDRDETPLAGYLFPGEIIAEHRRAGHLLAALPPDADRLKMTWNAFETAVMATGKALPEGRPEFQSVIEKFRTHHQGATVADFAQHLEEVYPALEKWDETLKRVQGKAMRNQDVYLTWDHMDIYFATSMRKRWEFEDLHDFVRKLMAQPELVGVRGDAGLGPLKLRHFDPTQAFMPDRVNKGLVEALMLKRARCTVYSVQDTDTLGKDSELAATLAQGKPVIVYVPEIRVEDRMQRLLSEEDPATIQDRLRFVESADEKFFQSLQPGEREFLDRFAELKEYEQCRVWRSVPDQEAIESLRSAHGADIERLCRIIALSEKRIYDKREYTLRCTHPLGIQVNLDTGVANGVLVVRTVEGCARLLRAILTNRMEFEVEETDNMWYLRECLTGSVFRVVTRDRKLTNCFWNFYSRP
jgi:hypothetical protein